VLYLDIKSTEIDLSSVGKRIDKPIQQRMNYYRCLILNKHYFYLFLMSCVTTQLPIVYSLVNSNNQNKSGKDQTTLYCVELNKNNTIYLFSIYCSSDHYYIDFYRFKKPRDLAMGRRLSS
jgi:hypothetical protein